MTALLTTQSLSVHIGDKSVCENVQLVVNSGECWAILGINGVGKTTLLHTLGGLRPAKQGSVCYQGQNIKTLPKQELAQLRGFLFQDISDPFPATVMETVLIGRHPHLKQWQWESAQDKQIANQALAEVGLGKLANRVVSTLSGGERRRLALAGLLTQQPQVYLLDEPTNHLDLQYQIQTMQLLSQRAKHNDAALVMILHDINLAARYCDRVLMLFGEGKTAIGTTTELLSEQTLTQLYNFPVHCMGSGKQAVFMPRFPTA